MKRWLLVAVLLCTAMSQAMGAPLTGEVRRLPVLLQTIDADLDRETLQGLNRHLEDELFAYGNLAVITRQELANQIGWERKQQRLHCRLPEDCMFAIKDRLGLCHEIRAAILPLAEGGYNVRLELVVGEEGREFVESIPELSAAKLVISHMVPDLIGKPSGLGSGQGVARVTSFPLGADVSLDGRIIGRTPLSIIDEDGEVLRLKASREGHPPVYDSLKLEKRKTKRWFADLVTRQGEILVDTVPPGATIILDGRSVGTSPMVVSSVLAGEHKLELSMPPYPKTEIAVRVEADNVTRVRHGFIPEEGTLDVSLPETMQGRLAEIFLNGEKVAENIYRAKLPEGEYKIEIVADGFKTYRKQVRIEPGETATVVPDAVEGLSLRPGEQEASVPDYRPGGFSTALGALALGFGIFLELEAQKHYDKADEYDKNLEKDNYDGERETALYTRVGGGICMGLGSAALIAGVVLLIIPPETGVAVVPEVDPKRKEAMLRLKVQF